MPTISIDSSDLRRLQRDLERIQAQLPQAIARGLNEGGDKVRTQVQRAIQKQTSLVKYSSVTSRVRTVRAYATGMDAKSGIGPPRPASMSYTIIVSGVPPTKIDEFKTRVTNGPSGGVTAIMWGNPHKFVRSFQQKDKGGLRARVNAEEAARLLQSHPIKDPGRFAKDIARGRLPIRGFDGPNLCPRGGEGPGGDGVLRYDGGGGRADRREASEQADQMMAKRAARKPQFRAPDGGRIAPANGSAFDWKPGERVDGPTHRRARVEAGLEAGGCPSTNCGRANRSRAGPPQARQSGA